MPQNNISLWLSFVQEQIAAESYFDDIDITSTTQVADALVRGNNRRGFPEVGLTRLVQTQADQFAQRYQIVDHHADDASGFSATLLKDFSDPTGKTFTLSFRSLEYQNQVQGGDWERDGAFASGLTPAASGEIAFSGFAFGQLMSMERYFANLQLGIKSDGTVDAGLRAFFSDPSNRINVTGYSLGGHLATIFTELHTAQVAQTYIFNGSGRGRIEGFTGTDGQTLAAEAEQIDVMLDRFNAILFNPRIGLTQASDEDIAVYQAAQHLHDASQLWNPFESGSSDNLYLDPRYQWAKLATLHEVDTVGTAELEVRTGLKGIAIDQGAVPRIVQLNGLAATDDANVVAVSGLYYGPPQPILIEGQPLLVGELGLFPQFNESGSSHSITLIVDALAVQDLIHTIDDRYGQASAELLIRAVSNARAFKGVAELNTPGVAEADSLGQTIDAFRKLFRDPTLPSVDPLPIDSRVGGFGDFNNRTQMYAAIQEVREGVETLHSQGVALTITDLTDSTIDRALLLARADMDTSEGLAYRYALKELNPFVVTTNSSFETGALYAAFNTHGELDLFSPAKETGIFTTSYIDDRAAFLREKVALNQRDRDTSTGFIYFFDALQTYEIATADDPATTRQFIFGSSADERFESGNQNDDLYGGGGIDLLIGNGGDDYLQGDDGGDQLEGGAGCDMLVGGAGNDLLEGGTENDTLDGGVDSDTLRGGAGLDRYIVHALDGADTIEDSDGKGVIEFDNQILLTGLHRTNDSANVFHTSDGTVTFAQNGADLTVIGSGPLTIKNFTNGQLGVKLFSEASYGDTMRIGFSRIDHYDPNPVPGAAPIPIYAPFFDDTANDSRSNALTVPVTDENNLIHAFGGNDFVVSGGGDDQLNGDGGDDTLFGGLGQDRVFGGIGDDQLYGDNLAVSTSGGNDYLDGGEGNDFVQGGAGHDILLGGGGDDSLNGDESAADNSGDFDDYLDGGAGNDELHGAAGGDVLIGGSGNDLLIGDTTEFQGGDPNAGGADALDGGAGADQLFGLYGDDLLVGGVGNDYVNGQDGNDVLYGGDGNDRLSGDLRIVPLTGFLDTREFRGAGGNDVIDGGAGDDELQGGEGNDVLLGGAGDDALFGEYNWRDIAPLDPLAATLNSLTGNDEMNGGDGNDNLYGGHGNDVLYGGAGIDFVDGGEGNDTLFGGAGDDLLDAGFGGGDNILFGEAGNDRLIARNGHDALYGGEGDDYLSGADGSTNVIGDAVLDGGSGNDSYVVDSIGDMVIEAADSGMDTVKSFINYTLPDAVENLTFDDSNVLLTDSNTHGIGNALDNVLSGGTSLEGLAGDDTLIGKGWLDGGTGDDILNGGSTLSFLDSDGGQHVIGNTYIFAAGYGHDTIQEYDADFFNSASYGNEDTLRFLAEITPTDVTWQRQGNDLLLSVNDGADLVTVRSYFDLLFRQGSITALGVTPPPQGFIFSEVGAPFYVAPSRIETVRFADGTAWGADRFGAPLLGDTQSDTYQFGIGTGQMTILDFDWRASSEGRSGNRDSIQVNSGVLPDDLVASRVNGNDLILSINGSTDQVTVQSFFTQVFITTFFTGRDVHPYEIEQIQFADGTVWNWNDLNNRIMSISGTEQADDLFGNDNDNVMHGLGGDDFIAGGQGNDVLDGGFGNDQLYGYEGNDTYLFGRGDGQDMVQNYDYTGADVDILKLGPDIAPSDVTVQVGEDDPADLVLKLHGTTDEITIDDFLFSERYRLDRIEFSDGISWDANAILAHGRGVDLVGTENADELEGSPFSDTLTGLGADDELAGSIGDDRLDGGAGDDILAGDEGNDTYLFQDEFGHDTIHEHDSAGTAVDTILFTGSVTPNDVTVRATVFDGLILGVNGSTDDILIDRFLSDRQYAIEVVQFADGTLWDLNSLLARGQGFDRTGTDSADFLPGSLFSDILNGLAGGDVLTGAKGNDVLAGGIGDDTYIFNIGDGIDTIEDSVTAEEGNRIQFGVGISQNALTYVRDPASLALTIQVGTSGADQLRLNNFDPSGLNGSLVVQTLAFADGSTLNLADLYPPNHAPTVANPLVSQTVLEDAPFSIQVPVNTFADPDAGDTLTYSATQADGSALPAWLSFNATTRAFAGTLDDAQVGTLNLTVKATDSGGLSATSTFALTVQNVNEAPVANPLTDQTVQEDTSFSITVSANTFADPDTGDTLTYGATQADGSALPTWLSFNATTATFTGTPDDAQVGTVNLAVKATDSGGFSATSTFTLTVQNVNETPIVANPLLDQSTQVGQAFTFAIPTTTFTDPDASDTLTYSATLANGNPLPAWLTFNTTTRTFSGTPGSVDAGLVSLKVMVRDAGSLTVADVFDLTVNSGDQILTGTPGNDVLTAGAGNDQLFTLAGNDTLNGLAGNDLLDGGTGADTLRGGMGNDTYIVDNTGDVVTENANDGTDTVQSSITYILGANVENLTLTGTAAINGTGNVLDNVLLGNSGNNALTGGAGNDRLDGGAGNDTLVGGTGNDTYAVNQTGDVVTENANQGTDTVESSITYTLGSNVENLTLTGTANLNGTGSSANNVLLGNNGNNALDGGTGNDTVDGGAGNDTLQGGSGDDTVFGGLGVDILSAGSGNDLLDGGDGFDRLDGGSGDDILRGGAGNDTIAGGSGSDQFTGGTGNDTLNGGSGNDLYNFSRGDGQDTISDADATPGNQDRLLFGTTINPLDLVLSRQANDLRLEVHGATDAITIQNWYTSPTTNQIEDLQAGNGKHLLNAQVEQLIQAMASFSQQTGLSWDQAIDQRPQDVQTVLAASWH